MSLVKRKIIDSKVFGKKDMLVPRRVYVGLPRLPVTLTSEGVGLDSLLKTCFERSDMG